MLRFLLVVALGSGLALGVAWYGGVWNPAEDVPTADQAKPSAVRLAPGDCLYPAAPEAVVEDPAPAGKGRPTIVVLHDCHLDSVDRQEVASPREGQLQFIGEEVNEPKPGAPGKFLPTEFKVGKRVIVKTYRVIERDAVVRPGQMVALLNPAVALAEVDAARAKHEAAVAELGAAEAAAKESKARVERYQKLMAQRVIGAEDYSNAFLYWQSKQLDEVAKRKAIDLAAAEVDKALTTLDQHEIRNRMSREAVVRTVYKNGTDAVKAQEPILHLQSIQQLRAEGMIDVQDLNRLGSTATVTVEPIIPQAPWHTFPRHHGEVTGVAFCGRGDELRVVSVSEDHTAYVRSVARPLSAPGLLRHPGPVRAVACSPTQPWCLTGCADGSLRLWDVPSGKLLREIKEGRHRGAVTAVAFSPRGDYFASGGEDGVVHIWQTEARGDGFVYTLAAEAGAEQTHLGAVTALHFTPQARLISAGRDNTLRVWKLGRRAAELEQFVGNRSGTVATLGVSPDGGRMLFDLRESLQVLSVRDGRTVGEVQSSFGATPFEALALFSPDARLLLTAGAPEGRLQLWHLPPGQRAYEVRLFAARERSPATCAAFAPEGPFAASGTRDGRVHLWELPSPEAVRTHRIPGLRLTQVGSALDANSRQVRIGVDVTNPRDPSSRTGYRLIPGGPVTLVIEP
jgi:WD40 repeat protein